MEKKPRKFSKISGKISEFMEFLAKKYALFAPMSKRERSKTLVKKLKNTR